MSETYVFGIVKVRIGRWHIHFSHNGIGSSVILNTSILQATSGGMRVDFATAIQLAWEHTPATEVRFIDALGEIKKECGIPNAQGSFNYSLEQRKLLEVQHE